MCYIMSKLSTARDKFSSYNRKRKMKFIQGHISDTNSIIDIGIYPIKEIPISTNYFEEYFLSQNKKITALGLESEDFSFFKERYKNCELITFDGFDFSVIRDKYDVALCNAVVEHVCAGSGMFPQLSWLKEIRTFCNKLIITTPNKYFPVEAHTAILFLHWLKPSIRKKAYKLFKIHQEVQDTLEVINLLSKREFLRLLNQAGFKVVALKKNRALWMTADFVAVCI